MIRVVLHAPPRARREHIRADMGGFCRGNSLLLDFDGSLIMEGGGVCLPVGLGGKPHGGEL
jgi:hypothetical protein